MIKRNELSYRRASSSCGSVVGSSREKLSVSCEVWSCENHIRSVLMRSPICVAMLPRVATCCHVLFIPGVLKRFLAPQRPLVEHKMFQAPIIHRFNPTGLYPFDLLNARGYFVADFFTAPLARGCGPLGFLDQWFIPRKSVRV